MYLTKKVHFLIAAIASLLTFPTPDCLAQAFTPTVRSGNGMWQYGGSLRLSVCFFHGVPELKLGLGCGIGVLTLSDAVFPSAHTEWHLLLNGMGTKAHGGRRQHYNLRTDFALCLSVTGKMGKHLEERVEFNAASWNQPLYYWSDFVSPPLQNPYWNSLTASKMFVFRPDKKGLLFQQVGFLGLHINQLDISYFNDGGPLMSWPIFGDGKDRWYTGGGMVACHLKTVGGINFIEGAYHKFSGYNESAFEYADVLDFAYVPYHDAEEHEYSRSQYTFRAGNTINGWSAFVRIHNPPNRIEIQNLIHYITDNPYHLSPYPAGLSVGGDYSPAFSKIHLK